MIIESLPIIFEPGPLRASDVLIYATRLKEELFRVIPTASDVAFLDRESFFALPIELEAVAQKRLFQQVLMDKNPIKLGSYGFVFPLPAHSQLVAVVTGVDRFVVERASPEWLREIMLSLEQNLGRLRRIGMDGVTSLPTALEFNDSLAMLTNEHELHVVLVEIFPRAGLPKAVFTQIRSAARILMEYNRFSFPLFHFGQSVFAFIITNKNRAFLKSFCQSLISYVKSKGCKRVHCGSSSRSSCRHVEQDGGADVPTISDEAWHALHVACRRGPFAFCDFEALMYPESLALQPLAELTKASAQQKWKQMSSFSLVLFTPDRQAREVVDHLVLEYFEDEQMARDECGYLLIRENDSVEEAKQWAEHIIATVKNTHGERASMSAGISSYPFGAYSKTDIIRNCRKALLHASFFGPGAVVIFDALSLNVSGDVYFNEGDFAGAVREYRQGLKLDAADVNLLNSLGVTYALMNRRREALAAFTKVLSIDPDNFMALYNIGLDEQAAGNYHNAGAHFSRALDVHNPKDEDEISVLSDLNYQLGVALFHQKNYRASSALLQDWYESLADPGTGGKCCRYIGMGYYYLDEPTVASKWLQRALVFDEGDAESMSLLGQLYLDGKEGDDIALKFCEKSVELAGDDCALLLRYGRALAACDDERAINCFNACLRKKQTKYKAWYELAALYRRQGQEKKAAGFIKRLLHDDRAPKDLRDRARVLLNNE